jgi:ArsR family transcriptional regulator
MHKSNKRNVLFVCSENAARSQIAEALLRHRAGNSFNVYSAGTYPTQVDKRAINTLNNYGANSDNLVSKNITTFEDTAFDYVITLCDKANEECRSYANAGKQFAWDLPDPRSSKQHDAFTTTLIALNSLISMFLSVENTNDAVEHNATSSVAFDRSTSLAEFDPISFYKCLTDTIRLKTLMLTFYHGELCVCELMQATGESSQPKVSRNLAVLKKAQVIVDRKHGQWVFYRINPTLPLWAKTVIAQTTENNIPLIKSELHRLNEMQNRPDKSSFCN